ncbi:MAG: hypothetical protein WD988_01050 [Candidatus Curtissbacteria bacterium]
MNKPTVLLDIDDTILDISSVKKQISAVIDDNYGEGTSEKFWQIYDQVYIDLGFVKVDEIAMRFAKAVNSPDYASAVAAFVEVQFEDYLLPGAKELTEFLGVDCHLVIFTSGDELFQGEKVKRLGLDKIAKEVIISHSKKDLFSEMANKYQGTIIIVDDKPEVLEKAKEDIPSCVLIRIKFGKYAKDATVVDADFETDNLMEVKNYIEKLVEKKLKSTK